MKRKLLAGTALNIGGAAPIAPANVGLGSVSAASIVTQLFITFTWIVGVASVFSLLYAGFQYMTAGGDDDRAANSRRQIVFSIIGIILASSTFFIYQASRNLVGGLVGS